MPIYCSIARADKKIKYEKIKQHRVALSELIVKAGALKNDLVD